MGRQVSRSRSSKARGHRLVEGQHVGVLPAGQVHETGVHAACLEHQHGIVGAVGLALRAEELAAGGQVIVVPHVAERADAPQGFQAGTHPVDAPVHERVRLGLVEAGVPKRAVAVDHLLPHRLEGVDPGRVPGGEQGIDAGGPGLLVLQQGVGNAAVGRHHESPAIQVGTGSAAHDDLFHDLAETGHRGPANLLYRMFTLHDLTFSVGIARAS